MSTKLSEGDRRWLQELADELDHQAGALGEMVTNYRQAIDELDTEDADDSTDLAELDALSTRLDEIIGQLDEVRDNIRDLLNPTEKEDA